MSRGTNGPIGEVDESPSNAIVKPKKHKPYGGAGGINPKHANLTLDQRCRAHKKNGDRCKLPPIYGTTVCGSHGGRSPRVRAKAQRRLEAMANDALSVLAKVLRRHLEADDPDLDAAALRAASEVLNRLGISEAHKVDITHDVKKWEVVMEGVQRGARRDAAPMVVEGEIVGDAEFGDGRSE